MCVSVAKLCPNIKCTTICSEYYYDLQSSNPLFNRSTLFLLFGAYRRLLKNSTERFNNDSKERFTKISKKQAVAMKLFTNNIDQRPFGKHTICLP